MSSPKADCREWEDEAKDCLENDRTEGVADRAGSLVREWALLIRRPGVAGARNVFGVIDLLPPNPLGIGGTSGRPLLCETECANDRLTDAPSPPFELERGVAIVGREGVAPPIDFRGVRDGGGRNAPPREARDRSGARGVETPFVEALRLIFSGLGGRDFGLAECVGVPIVECERLAAATRLAASS